MRIYLAARNYRLDELRGYADDLRRMGHEVTSRWLQGRHQAPGSLDHPQWPGIAQEDVDDLAAADAVISITEPDQRRRRRTPRGVWPGAGLGQTDAPSGCC